MYIFCFIRARIKSGYVIARSHINRTNFPKTVKHPEIKGGAGHGDIVLVNNGKEVNFVQTDNNFVFPAFLRHNSPHRKITVRQESDREGRAR